MRLPPIPFPEAVATSAVLVKQRGEEDKLAAGLHKLHEEDPTFHFEYSSELGQTLIHGMGERHFDTILNRLERKFGVHAELVRPRIAYRETIKGKAEGQGKHKKQSGGRGQYGDCWIRMAPLSRGSGYQFENEIVGGVIPGKYMPGGGPRHPGGRRAGRRSPDIRWWTSRSNASTAPITTWIPTRCRSRWPASGLQERRPTGSAGVAGTADGRRDLGPG